MLREKNEAERGGELRKMERSEAAQRRQERGGEREAVRGAEAVLRESLSGESDGAERVERGFRERNNGNSQLFFFFINVYLISYVHVFI